MPSKPIKLTQSEIKSAFSKDDWGKTFPPILTLAQACELLQVPKGTIYDWSSRGLLKNCCRRRGKHLRFWRDALVAFIFIEEIDE